MTFVIKEGLSAAYFESLWAEAKAAGQRAAQIENNRLGPEGSRGLDCGFAWLTLPGTLPFSRWAKKAGLTSRAHPTGLMIRYTKVHELSTQSVSVHEAACRAARDVLVRGLGTSQIGMASRLD